MIRAPIADPSIHRATVVIGGNYDEYVEVALNIGVVAGGRAENDDSNQAFWIDRAELVLRAESPERMRFAIRHHEVR